MFIQKLRVATVLGCLFAAPASWAISYSQDLEGLDPLGATALSDDGWLVGGTVTGGATGDYGYFAFPAPNGGAAFSAVATGEGGAPQGANQLSIYGDYNNSDHGVLGATLTAFVFNNLGVLAAGDAGQTYTFSFDTKQGNTAPPSTAEAFILVQQTSNGSFATLARVALQTEALGTDWSSQSLDLLIDPTWVGETLQIGFTATTTGVGAGNPFNPTGVFYDNLNVSAIPVPAAVWLFGSALGLLGAVRRRMA